MARFSVEAVTDTCPFFYAAALQLDGARARIHAVGEGEKVAVHVGCLGAKCMMFTQTGKHPETQEPVGGCSIAVLPSLFVQLNTRLQALNDKVDTLALSSIEAASSVEEKGGSFLAHFAKRLRLFFAQPDDAPAKTDKPKLEGLDGGKK